MKTWKLTLLRHKLAPVRNISRYVSTAEAEKEINLAMVYADLLAAEQKIAVAKERHNQYLAELKLPLLP